MPLDVAVYLDRRRKRSVFLGQSMAKGIKRAGENLTVMDSQNFDGVNHDVAVFYGFEPVNQQIFNAYRAALKPVVYIDLGYWHRRQGGLYAGYHKITVNSRHPNAYYRNHMMPNDRFNALEIDVWPWRPAGVGKFILLVGMQPRAAELAGYGECEWEKKAITEIKERTDLPIIYRPKPNWKQAYPLPGTKYQRPRPKTKLQDALRDCHAVVSHHSNMAVEAICHGVPSFTWGGVGTALSSQDWDEIETPKIGMARKAWLNQIAYCQWSVAEIETGLPWLHLKRERLLLEG